MHATSCMKNVCVSSDSSISAATVHILCVASATVRGVSSVVFIMWWVASVNIMFDCSAVSIVMGDAGIGDDRLY